MHCGPSYPDTPPTIQFISQINLPAVDQRTGTVDASMLPCLSGWKRENTMETVLIELRRSGLSPNSLSLSHTHICPLELLLLTMSRYMAAPANKKLAQPPEGSTYS